MNTNTQPGDWGKNKVTFHHNWFADNVVQRGNTFDRTTGSGPDINGKQGKRFETSPDQPFEVKALSSVPYTYVATPSADIPALVSKYAGPQ